MSDIKDLCLWALVTIAVSSILTEVNSLKPGDCEGKLKVFHVAFALFFTGLPNSILHVSVCISVVERFSQSLSDNVKKDTKKIENKFREFCRDTKSKENRFVSVMFAWHKGLLYWNDYSVIIWED